MSFANPGGRVSRSLVLGLIVGAVVALLVIVFGQLALMFVAMAIVGALLARQKRSWLAGVMVGLGGTIVSLWLVSAAECFAFAEASAPCTHVGPGMWVVGAALVLVAGVALAVWPRPRVSSAR